MKIGIRSIEKEEMASYILDNSFLSANYVAILENMLGEVDGWNRTFDLDLLYRPLDVCAHGV